MSGKFWGSFVSVVVFVALLLLVAWVIPWPGWRWGAEAALMVLFVIALGIQTNGRADGFLIDSRFKISLSRLQIILWTIMIMSAYMAIALRRAWTGVSAPLQIALPPEVLVAMGISTATFAGSGLIKSAKTSKTVNIDLVNKKRTDIVRALENAEHEHRLVTEKLKRLGDEQRKKTENHTNRKANLPNITDPSAQQEEAQKLTQLAAELELINQQHDDTVNQEKLAKQAVDEAQRQMDKALKDEKESEGVLHRNATAVEARWMDMFRGEEITNNTLIDEGKIQMFFITIAVVFSYCVAIFQKLESINAAAGFDFPELSTTVTALLGISHGGYLVSKAIDKTPTQPGG